MTFRLPFKYAQTVICFSEYDRHLVSGKCPTSFIVVGSFMKLDTYMVPCMLHMADMSNRKLIRKIEIAFNYHLPQTWVIQSTLKRLTGNIWLRSVTFRIIFTYMEIKGRTFGGLLSGKGTDQT